jgi:hypothetical protein
MLLISILLSFLVNDFVLIKKAKTLLMDIMIQQCSDDITNKSFVYVIDIMEQVNELYLMTIILYVIMLFISIFKILLTSYKIYKNRILQSITNGNLEAIEMVLLL